MKISHKLVILAVLPILVLISVVTLSLSNLTTVSSGIQALYNDRIVPMKQLKIVNDQLAIQVVGTINRANAGLISSRQARQNISDAHSMIQTTWQSYMDTDMTEMERNATQTANQQLVNALKTIKKLEMFIAENEDVKFKLSPFYPELYKEVDPFSQSIIKLIQIQLDIANDVQQDFTRIAEKAALIMLSLTAVVVLLLSGMGYALLRSIRVPLNRLNEKMHSILANQDLTQRVEVSGRDELSEIASSFNQMMDNTHTVVSGIADAAVQLASAAEQTSAASLQTTTAVAHQRQEVEQTVAAMNEMAASAEQIASSANQADEEAQRTLNEVNAGNQVVRSAVNSTQAMVQDVTSVAELIRTVEQNSHNINDIMNVIDTIAEQTNLLALNAAIEAARAGDAGRGFSVVADEVRGLAQRTQDSTGQIKEAIELLQNSAVSAVESMEASRERAEHTGEQAAAAGDTLERIAEAVSHITEMNTQVASASQEQTAVCETINQSLVVINNGANETEAGTSHISQASSDIARLAAELQGQVNTFKI